MVSFSAALIYFVIFAGLEFLEATPEFQEKYARTVIARIFYNVNKRRNGKITMEEFCKSNITAGRIE